MIEIRGKIEGKDTTSELTSEVRAIGPNHFAIASNDRMTEIFITDRGLLSNGNSLDSLEVEFESESQRIIRERFKNSQSASAGKESGTKGVVLKAAMPGIVKAVTVKIGDIVQKNTQVLVLEAMKMENSITAGFAGAVSKIHVQAGDTVEKNMPILEFETV